MEEPQKLFRLPGTIEEDEERDSDVPNPVVVENPARADSPLLGQRSIGPASSLPRNITLVRVSTQSSSIGGVGRQDSTRSRYRAGPTRKLRRRAVLKNGECNVLQSRMPRRSLRFLQDIFTTLVDTQWRWTLLCFTLSFVLSWLGFAVIWWLIAFTHGDFEERHLPPFQVENNWTPCIYNIFSFTSCFLFSIETQHTIGYGSRSTTEECPEAIFVMCIQSIAGVMIQAFMVGIVFAKMSRPKQRTQTLLFSRNAVICQRDGELCLMFRVGDMRKSHIIGAGVRAQVIRTKTTKEGEVLSQNQHELEVGTDGQNGNLFFIWPTTIVHKINKDSPFYNMSAEDMLTERFEIVVILEGTIESTGQTTQARSSYLPQEILWGHRFEPMVMYSKERQGYEVDYSLFNNTTQVDTPLCSGRELAEFYRVQDEIRQGSGVVVDEDLMLDSSLEMQPHCQCVHCYHRQLSVPGSRPNRVLIHMDSVRSDNSAEDSVQLRNACRDANCVEHGPQYQAAPGQSRDTGQYRPSDVQDPDAMQVMGDVDFQQLPEAVNREIVKNSREIVFEENSRDVTSPVEECQPLIQTRSSIRKSLRYPLLDEERRSLNGSKRNLKSPILHYEDERRSLNGSKKYILLTLDRSDSVRNSYTNTENLIRSRRHTGSRERLSFVRRNVCAKGSKETPEFRPRRRLNGSSCYAEQERSSQDSPRVMYSPRIVSPSLPEITPLRNAVTSNGTNAVRMNETHCQSDRTITSQTDCATSPFSDLSPESGFYEGNQSNSSPEIVRRTLPGSDASARNRKSYEHAQLQDVNQALARQNSGSSSTDSDGSAKNLIGNGSGKIGPVIVKQSVPYTTV